MDYGRFGWDGTGEDWPAAGEGWQLVAKIVVVGRDPRDGTGKEGPLGEEGLDWMRLVLIRDPTEACQ